MNNVERETGDRVRRRNPSATLILFVAWLASGKAHASFLSGEALDTAADVISWVVVCFVPIVAIVIFWMVHVLPEKVAEKRHHPQKDAIKTLCMLSLVFGGLLWPFAWLWAYAKPTQYRMAYGTDKHDDYFVEMTEKVKTGSLVGEEIEHLRHELDAMADHGQLPPKLKALRAELDSLHAQAAAARATDSKSGTV